MSRALVLIVLIPALAAAEPIAGKRPNIVFVLIDDQGYGDLSCHGNPILKTPNMDRLHDEGVRFLDFYVSPTCSPTRSCLMSGKHEFKNGVTHTIMERERMSLKTYTLPQALKSAGYTTGIFGKWHLGDEDAYQPGQRGFDEVFIHGAGGIGQTYPGSCGDAPGNKYFDPAIRHNGLFEKTKGYCTDLFFGQAIRWIDAVRGKSPFFAYIATNAPHVPLVCPDDYIAKYKGKVTDDQAKFFGMIANIDDNLGVLLAKLKEWNLERDTLVIFMNDNGGTVGVPVFNAGMRGEKVTPYRGGTRGACFFRWAGTLTPGDRVQTSAHIDIFPTLADIAGAKVPDEAAKQFDGRSLAPVLENASADWPDRFLFTHVGRWPKGKAEEWKYVNCSVRYREFSMVSVPPKNSKAKSWELFDLSRDPGEKTNVIAKNADVAAKMERAYEDWWQSIVPCLVNEDAVGPAENPFKTAYWKQFGR
jgi:arylsulfatase A-like enzyme